MGLLLKLVAAVAVAYGVAVAVLWLVQGWLIFPAAMAVGSPPLPDGAERLTVTAADGTELVGHHLTVPGGDGERPLILGFGGNAWDADAVALTLRGLFPEHPVAAFHYRGYGPSGGRAAAAPILSDALDIHDALLERLNPASVVVVGFSIGSGPAARVAAERTVAGAILVTPFDSLARLAAGHMPWAPVRALIRHRMPVAEDVAQADVPVAVITAQRDTIVPAARSAPVAEAARQLVFREEIAGVGHNDLYAAPAFERAMRRALTAIEVGGGAGG